MCRTMKELERVVNDYRAMKALLTETEEEAKVLEADLGFLDEYQRLSQYRRLYVK